MTQFSVERSADLVSWGLVAAMACTSLVACHSLGFRIDVLRAFVPVCVVAALAGAAIWGRAQGRPRLESGATAFLQMTLFTIVGVVLAYALAARGRPLWDAMFATADVALGFDWPAVYRAADQLPLALYVGGIAYHSLTVQMIVCIVVLSATGRAETLRIAVAIAIAAGFVTIAISGVVPAMGNLFDPTRYQHLWPSVAWVERDWIIGLRDGSLRVLDLTQLMGIVSFPSYHATLPIILAWAQRDVPRWRIVAPVWAGLTIVATPLFGGHYGIDVLAGIVLAVVAIVVGPGLIRRLAIGGDGEDMASRRSIDVTGDRAGVPGR
jgi:hypothetical protein